MFTKTLQGKFHLTFTNKVKNVFEVLRNKVIKTTNKINH